MSEIRTWEKEFDPFFTIYVWVLSKNWFLEKPRNDSGVSSEDKSSEEWQDLQKLYGQKPDSNGNSNNNSVSFNIF